MYGIFDLGNGVMCESVFNCMYEALDEIKTWQLTVDEIDNYCVVSISSPVAKIVVDYQLELV